MLNISYDDIDLNLPAPVKEPQRQYYYMKKAKAYVAALGEKLGRQPTACVNTFGCQMNPATMMA